MPDNSITTNEEIELIIKAIIRADGDRDLDNASNLTVEQTLAIADVLKRVKQ